MAGIGSLPLELRPSPAEKRRGIPERLGRAGTSPGLHRASNEAKRESDCETRRNARLQYTHAPRFEFKVPSKAPHGEERNNAAAQGRRRFEGLSKKVRHSSAALAQARVGRSLVRRTCRGYSNCENRRKCAKVALRGAGHSPSPPASPNRSRPWGVGSARRTGAGIGTFSPLMLCHRIRLRASMSMRSYSLKSIRADSTAP